MITYDDLVNGFGNSVEKISDGFFKFKIEVPAFTLFNYFWCEDKKNISNDFLLLSKDKEDDQFALYIYSQLPMGKKINELEKINISPNRYGFDSMLLVPAHYHGNFIGTLDEQRSGLVLCVPIFHYEFSGNESADEFREMDIKRVHTVIWTRKPVPKVFIRFNNPKTGAGTINNNYILTSDSYLMSEIYNLNGVENGFIDISNYMGDVLNIISNVDGTYRLKSKAGESVLDGLSLSNEINDFLTI
ncbi:hypothetical protein [Salmonella enterica]|uniref:hypothetical protein n=1 Tax=Salmonella enterica TaxID=28901 RepID=UPI0009B14FE8|nr:hypothetical protein [Salmonella enterica]